MADDRFIMSKHYRFWLSCLLFAIPFCYPFRPLIGRITHLHVYIVMYSAIWILLFSLLIKTRRLIISKGLSLMFAYYILLLPISPDYSSGLKWIINLLTGIVIAGFFNSNVKDEESEVSLWFPMIIGTLLCSILFLPSVVRLLPVSLKYNYLIRIPYMEGDISIGPNGWATTLAFSFLLLLFLFSYKKIRTFAFIFLIMAILFFMLLTQSRTQTYSVIAVSGIYIFINMFSRKHSINMNVLSFFFLGASVFLLVWIIRDSVAGSERIENLDFNGRFPIWNLAREIYWNDMNVLRKMFGVGTGGTSVYLQNVGGAEFIVTGEHISAHSIYIDSLISSGIIGSFIVIGYWLRAMWLLLKSQNSIYCIFPLYLLFSGIGTHAFMSWEYGFLIAFTEIGLYKYSQSLKTKMVDVKSQRA